MFIKEANTTNFIPSKYITFLEELDTDSLLTEKGIGLFHGATLYLNLFFNIGEKTGNEKLINIGYNLTDKILESINEDKVTYDYGIHSLSMGYAGLALSIWNLNKKHVFDIDFEKEFEVLDNLLFTLCIDDLKKGYIDYLHGPFGVLLYFSKRQENKRVREYTNTIISEFHKTCKIDDMGLRVYNLVLEDSHQNNFDLGVAHGLSGILIILNEINRMGNNNRLITDIINSSMLYINNKFREKEKDNIKCNSYYPSSIDENYSMQDKINVDSYNSRIAWCYGDLNQVLLRINLSKDLNKENLVEHAKFLASDTLLRTRVEDHQILSEGICHGSSGVAMIYKWMFEKTGDRRYFEGSNHWFEKTLQYLNDIDPVRDTFSKKTGLLEGYPGALMALCDDGNYSILRNVMLLN